MILPKKICFAQPNSFILKAGGCGITWKTSNICPVIYPTPVDAQYFAVAFGIEYQLEVKCQFYIFILSLSPTSVRVQQWISDLSLTNPDRQVCMCVFVWVCPCVHLCNCVFVYEGLDHYLDWPSRSDRCACLFLCAFVDLCVCTNLCMSIRGWVTDQAGQTGVYLCICVIVCIFHRGVGSLSISSKQVRPVCSTFILALTKICQTWGPDQGWEHLVLSYRYYPPCSARPQCCKHNVRPGTLQMAEVFLIFLLLS